jgi:hypothetical protein
MISFIITATLCWTFGGFLTLLMLGKLPDKVMRIFFDDDEIEYVEVEPKQKKSKTKKSK